MKMELDSEQLAAQEEFRLFVDRNVTPFADDFDDRGRVPEELEAYAKLLHSHGALSDRVESRKAFAEKRKPNWKGWDNPGDRERTPKFRVAQK